MDRSYPLGLLSMDGEQNIPTMFSVALLWLCALFAGCIAVAEESGGRLRRLQWGVLAVVFLFAGVDEFTEMHERLTEPLRNALNAGGLFYFAWVVPYVFFALLFTAMYFRFFMRLPGDTRKFVVLAVILYVGGSIGMEMIGGAWVQLHGKDWAYYLLVMVEEMMEMAGSIAFIYAFANHVDKHLPGFSLRITSS
ncbi:MAG: hypothetical protein ABFR47_05510 [Verrucomicrobiota bacterium]